MYEIVNQATLSKPGERLSSSLAAAVSIQENKALVREGEKLCRRRICGPN